jgi:hypothetical protein
MPMNQAEAQISTKNDRNELPQISGEGGGGGGGRKVTLDDLPPDLDLHSALEFAAVVTAGVFGAAEESRESASDARRSLAPSSRSPATARRCLSEISS